MYTACKNVRVKSSIKHQAPSFGGDLKLALCRYSGDNVARELSINYAGSIKPHAAVRARRLAIVVLLHSAAPAAAHQSWCREICSCPVGMLPISCRPPGVDAAHVIGIAACIMGAVEVVSAIDALVIESPLGAKNTPWRVVRLAECHARENLIKARRGVIKLIS